eukprot:15365374-Ditylum_brightwellii.AAC.1
MNIAADLLATEFHAQHGKAYSHVPRLTINKVQLSHPHMTITNKYFKTIRDIAITPALNTYTLEKNTWTQAIYGTVDWKVYQ